MDSVQITEPVAEPENLERVSYFDNESRRKEEHSQRSLPKHIGGLALFIASAATMVGGVIYVANHTGPIKGAMKSAVSIVAPHSG
jgi:hypothetical protein